MTTSIESDEEGRKQFSIHDDFNIDLNDTNFAYDNLRNHSSLSLSEANKNKSELYPPTKLELELKREITKSVIEKINAKRRT